MAVVDEPKKIDKVVDLTAKDLVTGAASVLDLEADAYARAALVPAGRYDLKLAMGTKDPVKLGYVDEKKPETAYYSVNFTGTIVNHEEYEARIVFITVSTKVNKSNISRMAHVLARTGIDKNKLKGKEITPLALTKAFATKLASNPIIKHCLIDWSGYSKADGQTVYRGMDKFPLNEDTGLYEQEVQRKATSTGQMELIEAKLEVKDWGDGYEADTAKQPTKVIKAESTKTKPVDLELEDDEKPTTNKPVKASKVKEKEEVKDEDDDDDLSSMLG